MEKQTIKIERGIKNGRNYIKINGQSGNWYRISREITRTTHEEGTGIFETLPQKIWYGEQEKIFTEFKRINYEKDSLKKISEEIKRRVKIIRAWIATLDYEEDITFTV